MVKRKTKPAKAAKGVTNVDTLSERERRFVEAFMGPAKGNATEAARIVEGENGLLTEAALRQAGSRMLKRKHVKAAIDQRAAKSPEVKQRKELQQFWSQTLEDPFVEMRDRLRASELLGRSQAVFKDSLEHSGDVGVRRVFYLPKKGRDPELEQGDSVEPGEGQV